MTKTNRKPADRLADIREQIKELQIEEEQLRKEFIAGDHDLTGDEHRVTITVRERNFSSTSEEFFLRSFEMVF